MSEDSAAPDRLACVPAAKPVMGVFAATAMASALKALADPLRLRMLSHIAADHRGESCVCDLLALSDVSQPTVSHHLRVMKRAGWLESERRGTWVWYRIVPSRRSAVTALLGSPTTETLFEPITDVEDHAEARRTNDRADETMGD